MAEYEQNQMSAEEYAQLIEEIKLKNGEVKRRIEQISQELNDLAVFVCHPPPGCTG